MNTTYMKSWPTKFLQVSDLIFDPCFMVDLLVSYLLEKVTFGM